ncbi:hypothetical protein MA16_Dca028328 [Dendrobium catenatum]|uniref:Uncharacterized protein n=1 Tax=Dendrobium catenatum TaxID=906689 RepID=A0A2I0VBH4_9ASPA|nr:hypothetical protein MA16_Dca028328 [Dendrobium catenatum]
MGGSELRHLRIGTSNSTPRRGIRGSRRLTRRLHRGLFQRGVRALGISLRDALIDRCAALHNGVRLRRHRRRRGSSSPRPDLP